MILAGERPHYANGVSDSFCEAIGLTKPVCTFPLAWVTLTESIACATTARSPASVRKDNLIITN